MARHSKPVPLFVAPPPQQIFETIKAFAPQIGRITFASGTVIGLAALVETQEQALVSAVQRAIKTKVKRKTEDNQQVIKVKDAIDCVEKHVWDAKNLVTTAKSLVNVLTGGSVSTIANVIVQSSVDCIRENALRQNTPRTLGTSRYYQRPARGHGRGRKSF